MSELVQRLEEIDKMIHQVVAQRDAAQSRVKRLEAALRDLLKHTDELRGESLGEACPICEDARAALTNDAGEGA